MKEDNMMRKALYMEIDGKNISSWLRVEPWEDEEQEKTTYNFNIAKPGQKDADATMVFDSLDGIMEAHRQLGLFLEELANKDPEETEDGEDDGEDSYDMPPSPYPSETLAYRGRTVTTVVSMEPGANHGDMEDCYFFDVSDEVLPVGTLSFKSLEQMEEFFDHISEYIGRQKKSVSD